MLLFTIPRHKRFAVTKKVHLRGGAGEAYGALLFEVSLQGCRVSSADYERFRIDQLVTVEIAGFGDLRGQIRSASQGQFAIRFDQPIASTALHELIWPASDEVQPILQLPAFATAR